MILIDNRVGSAHLLPLLAAKGLPAKLVRLHSGDAVFYGQGPQGRLRVCIEVKRLDDFLGSFLTKRLAKQLRKMHQGNGGYSSLWLLLQGEYRESRDGLIEKKRGRDRWQTWQRTNSGFPWEALTGTLITLAMKAKVTVVHTRDDRETARMIGVLYKWWSKRWDAHHAHHGITEDFPEMWGADPFLRREPPPVVEYASLLPGIGLKKAEAVQAVFPTVNDAVLAPAREWLKVIGVGPKLAQRIFEWHRRRR